MEGMGDEGRRGAGHDRGLLCDIQQNAATKALSESLSVTFGPLRTGEANGGREKIFRPARPPSGS